MIKLTKKILCVVLSVLTVTLMFSSCTRKGMKITAFDVDNSEFFERSANYFFKNNQEFTEDCKYFALSSSFSMSSEEFISEFIHNYDSTTGMQLRILVENRNKVPVTVNGIKTENNGYEDTYLSSLIGYGGPVTVEPQSKTEISVFFVGNGGLYTNEEFLTRVIKEMDLSLSCVFPDSDEEVLLEVKVKPQK